MKAQQKGGMEPAWLRGIFFPQELSWHTNCLTAPRSIDFTSNHKENIILPRQARAKNVNKDQGLHPGEGVPQ